VVYELLNLNDLVLDIASVSTVWIGRYYTSAFTCCVCVCIYVHRNTHTHTHAHTHTHTQRSTNVGPVHRSDKNSAHPTFLHKRNRVYQWHCNCHPPLPACLPPPNL
jgi:hypothetical protein